MTELTARALVSGRVQGVGYRQSCAARAQALSLAGWVRNLNDGRVEALVSGEETLVRELIAWMHRGPEPASVDAVDITAATESPTQPFSIRD